MERNDWSYLEHMLQACENIFEFMQGFESENDFVGSKVHRGAVTMELLSLGELVKKTCEHGSIDGRDDLWRNVIRFRDRTSHWYHTTDFSIVYTIVINRVPLIYAALQQQQRQQQQSEAIQQQQRQQNDANQDIPTINAFGDDSR